MNASFGWRHVLHICIYSYRKLNTEVRMRTNFSKSPKEIRLKIAAKIGVEGQRALGNSPGRLAVDELLYTGCHLKPVIQRHMLDSDDGIDDYTCCTRCTMMLCCGCDLRIIALMIVAARRGRRSWR